MDRFMEFLRTHRVGVGIAAGLVVLALIIGGVVYYGQNLPDENAKSASPSTSSSSTSTTTKSDVSQTEVTAPTSATTSTTSPSTASTAATITIRSITVAGEAGAPGDSSGTGSWQFPISASVTMSSGGPVALTYTFNLSDGTQQVVNSSTGTANTTWTLPHCTDGSFTVTVSGMGPARTSNKGYATWENC